MAGDHGSARDAPADHSDLFSNVVFNILGLNIVKPLEPRLVKGQRMGADEKPQYLGLVVELCFRIVILQGGGGIVCAMKGKEMARGALLLDYGGVAPDMGKKSPHDL